MIEKCDIQEADIYLVLKNKDKHVFSENVLGETYE